MTISSSWVKVHIWEHPSFQLKPGHVALELHNGGETEIRTYVSFWPHSNKCCSEPESHFADYQHDVRYEEKDPETFTIFLSQEGIEKIENAFNKFKADPYQWSPFGSSVFRRPYESNCAGLALYLLEKGGVSTDSFLNARISKFIMATFISIAIFGGVSYLSGHHLQVLNKKSLAYNQSALAYVSLCDVKYLCLRYIAELRNRLAEDRPNIDSEKVVKLERVAADTLLENGWDGQQEPPSSLLRNTLDNIDAKTARVNIAKTTVTILFLALSGFAVIANQQIWLKTVTPADVKKIVKKIEASQKVEKSVVMKRGLKNRTWIITCGGIGIGSLFLWYLKPKWT